MCVAGFIEDRFADRENRVLFVFTPHDVAGNIAVGEERIDNEAVTSPDDVFLTQINNGEVLVDLRAAFDLLAEFDLLFIVEINAFLDVWHLSECALCPGSDDRHRSASSSIDSWKY